MRVKRETADFLKLAGFILASLLLARLLFGLWIYGWIYVALHYSWQISVYYIYGTGVLGVIIVGWLWLA